jgi:integrase
MQSASKKATSEMALQAVGIICCFSVLILVNNFKGRKVSDQINEDILASAAKSTKVAYARYRAAYLATNPSVHSEESVLSYLKQCQDEKGYVSSTLWTVRSHVVTYLKLECKIEIPDTRTSTWIKSLDSIYYENSVICFLLLFEETHKKKKSDVFTHEELFEFINCADNRVFLVIKLVVLFCYFGALRIGECFVILRSDITLTTKGLLVSITRTKTDRAQLGTTFVIPYLPHTTNAAGIDSVDPIELYKEYMFKIEHIPAERFFLTHNRKTDMYKNSPISKNTMASFPRLVAEWLKKDNPKVYTGHSLRATSATILADSGASLENLKRHGGWKSTSVAEGYIRESMQQKTDVAVALSNPNSPSTTNANSDTSASAGIVFVNCVINNATFTGAHKL